MVSYILIAFMIISLTPASAAQKTPLCIKCHSVHFEGRGSCYYCHKGNEESARKNIAHKGFRAGRFTRFTIYNEFEMRYAERLMVERGCRRCHQSAGHGNRLAANLDDSALSKTAESLAFSIRRPVAGMPDFQFDEKDMTILVNIIIAGSQGGKSDKSTPVKVHFSSSAKKVADIFSAKCGSCHRLLSERLGSVGSGNTAPNLSGLFTEYYPNTFRENMRWTPATLNIWLKNPRQIKKISHMQPVTLTKKEANDLYATLTCTAR